MIRPMHIPIIAFSLVSSIHAETDIQTHAIHSFPVLAHTFNQTQCNDYLTKIFIHNNTALIPKFLDFIHHSSQGPITEVHARIISWALENKYSAIEIYVKTIAVRILRRTYLQKDSLLSYVMMQAITYNNIAIVEYLISRSSYRTIATTQYKNMTFLKYAKQTQNKEAEKCIQKAADRYEKRRYLSHPLVRAGLFIITFPIIFGTLPYLYINIFILSHGRLI